MFWPIVLAAVVILLVAGGAYQLVTGRYIGIGHFAATYEPSARAIRLTGCAAIVGALIGASLFLAYVTK
jgi:hypothetical protein